LPDSGYTGARLRPLAATAATHDLFLVTRNVKDFIAMPVTTINPWDPER
jgi:predicted nucleic acid-binding protein